MEYNKMDLNKMTTEELISLRTAIYTEINRRKQDREKELWGNVVAALNKYEEEVESICFETPEENAYIKRICGPGQIKLCYG